MARIVTERIICDRCGRKVNLDPFWAGLPVIKVEKRTCLRVTFREMRNASSLDEWGDKKTGELCADCMKSLNEWFAKGKEGEGC